MVYGLRFNARIYSILTDVLFPEKKTLQKVINCKRPECSKVTFLSPGTPRTLLATPKCLNLLYAMGTPQCLNLHMRWAPLNA